MMYVYKLVLDTEDINHIYTAYNSIDDATFWAEQAIKSYPPLLQTYIKAKYFKILPTGKLQEI